MRSLTSSWLSLITASKRLFKSLTAVRSLSAAIFWQITPTRSALNMSTPSVANSPNLIWLNAWEQLGMYCTQRQNFAYACPARRHTGFHSEALIRRLTSFSSAFFAAATLSIYGKSCARMRGMIWCGQLTGTSQLGAAHNGRTDPINRRVSPAREFSHRHDIHHHRQFCGFRT